jgi:hypothetical protein
MKRLENHMEFLKFYPHLWLSDIPGAISDDFFNELFDMVYQKKLTEFKNSYSGEDTSDEIIEQAFIDLSSKWFGSYSPDLDQRINFVRAKKFLSDKEMKLFRPSKKTEGPEFPHLFKCFKGGEQAFKEYFHNTLVLKYYDIDSEGYRWKGLKAELGFIAQVLLEKKKLITAINSMQDCARIFCPFFRVSFNEIDDRQFRRTDDVDRRFQEDVKKMIQ